MNKFLQKIAKIGHSIKHPIKTMDAYSISKKGKKPFLGIRKFFWNISDNANKLLDNVIEKKNQISVEESLENYKRQKEIASAVKKADLQEKERYSKASICKKDIVPETVEIDDIVINDEIIDVDSKVMEDNIKNTYNECSNQIIISNNLKSDEELSNNSKSDEKLSNNSKSNEELSNNSKSDYELKLKKYINLYNKRLEELTIINSDIRYLKEKYNKFIKNLYAERKIYLYTCDGISQHKIDYTLIDYTLMDEKELSMLRNINDDLKRKQAEFDALSNRIIVLEKMNIFEKYEKCRREKGLMYIDLFDEIDKRDNTIKNSYLIKEFDDKELESMYESGFYKDEEKVNAVLEFKSLMRK